MKPDLIKVVCDNTNEVVEVAMGSTIKELEQMLCLDGESPFLAAYVNNRVKELNYRVYTPISVRFVDITSFEGHRVYLRTATFILQKAIYDLYPQCRLHIRHSIGSSGYYCEIDCGDDTAVDYDAVKVRMEEIVDLDMPIIRQKRLTSDVRSIFETFHFDDKVVLLDTRPRLYSDLYMLDDVPGYFYGSLAPSTGYIKLFDIEPYYNGFYLALPLRSNPDSLGQSVGKSKMFDIFREYQHWVDIMGVSTVGELNSKVLDGDASELIKIAEVFHENKIASIAGRVAQENSEGGRRLVLVSGPSSSGKTTFAKRLGIQLRILGLKPVLISLDDYFVDRVDTPLDENGEYDYEALEAINLARFNGDLQRLNSGESVEMPRYDFVSGTSQPHNDPLTLGRDSILIIEGIHGLNPNLTPSIPDSMIFKIYISCFTSVAMDNMSRIATTDNRLLRRLIRDYSTRGSNGLATLSRWESVRLGEEKHIFTYQENADVMFNSSLFYEISVLKSFAEPILREVPDTAIEYGEVCRMLKFLGNFITIKPDEIPPTSLLREFVGGSSFKY